MTNHDATRFCRVMVAAILAIGLSAGTARAQQADDRAVRSTIEQYFKGHATAKAEVMRAAFLPTAHIEGLRNGVFTSWTVDEYVAGFRGQPAADDGPRRHHVH